MKYKVNNLNLIKCFNKVDILGLLNRIEKKILFSVLLLLCLGIFFSCKTEHETEHNTSLDINEYLSYARTDTIYPSAKQIEMLKAVMSKESFQVAPSIDNRAYWDKIAASESGKEYLDNALSVLDKEPEVPISDEIYRRANLEGNREIYKPRYYRTMEHLENFILAECIENKGRFLPQINIYIHAIMDMKSWLHPNHDSPDNDVLEGRFVRIDLGARKFGTDLALAEVLLKDKLSDGLRKEISNELQRRIINPYLEGCSTTEITSHRWFSGSSNWNAVCTSGSVFVSVSASNNINERIAAVGCALNSMKIYLAGFGDDGYCSEGVGYWNYGFGHYLYLAQTLYDYTEGKINLFEFDNPEKLKNIGSFPERYEIQNGKAAPFSDGSSSVSNTGGFSSIMSALHLGARKLLIQSIQLGSDLTSRERKTSSIISDEAAYQLIAWEHAEAFIPGKTVDTTAQNLPDYTYFDEFGMVISRGKQEVPFSVAIKAGHNAENHNHMDVGSYTIVLDRDHISGDIGAPSYIAGSFDDDNPARSSWGHPVPRIDNKLQSKGRKFDGKITATEFTETHDKVVMDIKGAYEISSLTKLIRTMKNNKTGLGAITIEDEFSSSKSVSFGTALMTLSEYEIVDANTVILTSKNQKIKVEVFSDDGALKITDELVPIEKLREGGPAYRIGVDFIKPVSKGTITIKYTPLL